MKNWSWQWRIKIDAAIQSQTILHYDLSEVFLKVEFPDTEYCYLCLYIFNSLNAKLNPICHLLALGAHHILYVGRIRINAVAVDKGSFIHSFP
jgi:hypothetical protein